MRILYRALSGFLNFGWLRLCQIDLSSHPAHMGQGFVGQSAPLRFGFVSQSQNSQNLPAHGIFFFGLSAAPIKRIFLLYLLLSGCLFGNEKHFPIASSVNVGTGPTIVIDPGHGGRDHGARGQKPFCEEKRICLQTARLVKKYLDQLGYHVIMTRDTDAFIPLARRVEIAKQADSQLFVSIHFNSCKIPTVQGVEVWFHDSKELAKRASASKFLADSILTRVLRRTLANSRGVKKGNFYVIRETSMPAVIVEGGFISHPTERANLKQLEYQEKIARGVADGIDFYFRKK